MDLVDLIDEAGLQQDDWSLNKPRFGTNEQLEVVGWSGKSGYNKYYVLKCGSCSQDSELFGQGYFKSKKGHLLKGAMPCGCSKSPKLSKEQFYVLCSRKAEELGYTFLGFDVNYRGQSSKIKMLCEKHGEWNSGTANHLIHSGNGCPTCASEMTAKVVSQVNKKPDEVMVESFFNSGSFHPDTKFWRSDRKDAGGCKKYWFMSCPDCYEQGESQSGNLQLGQYPCACSPMRQQECYINWIINGEGEAVAIKFGIARNSEQRLKQQERLSIYTIKQFKVYKFPTVLSCKEAERRCKQQLECGILTREEMTDGYTETTSIANLLKIIEIYQEHGGVENNL